MPVVIAALVYLGFFVALLWGWVLNIIALFHLLDGAITGLFVARLVGVFVAPLGALLGFFA